MQIGLSQIHQQLNEESKKLDGAPANDWEAFKLSIKPSNFSEMHQNNLQNIIQIISMTFNYITGSFC